MYLSHLEMKLFAFWQLFLADFRGLHNLVLFWKKLNLVFASKIYVFLFILSSWSSSFVLIPHYQCRLVRYRIQALKFGHKNWHWQSWHIFQYKTHMKISWHTTSGIQGQQYYAPNIQLNDFLCFVVKNILTEKLNAIFHRQPKISYCWLSAICKIKRIVLKFDRMLQHQR